MQIGKYIYMHVCVFNYNYDCVNKVEEASKRKAKYLYYKILSFNF